MDQLHTDIQHSLYLTLKVRRKIHEMGPLYPIQIDHSVELFHGL